MSLLVSLSTDPCVPHAASPICTTSYEVEPYMILPGPRHPYDERECIPWLSITVEHTLMALIPASSAYSHPGGRYDHTLGRNPLAVHSTYLPRTVDEFVRYTEQYMDARLFAAVPNYAQEKKNARETSWYNRWLHLPGDVRSIARCRALIRPDMLYVRCKEEKDYQWCLNKLLLDLYMLHEESRSEFPPGDHNLLGVLCFKPT